MEPTPKEIWKPVLGYAGLYEVSDHGRVKSLARLFIDRSGRKQFVPEKILKINVCRGYAHVILSCNGSTKSHKVHRLVLAAFVGISSDQGNHKDCNRLNNRLDNLEYLNCRENVHHWRSQKQRSLPMGVRALGRRYQARICKGGKTHYLGTYDTPDEAAKAYQAEIGAA